MQKREEAVEAAEGAEAEGLAGITVAEDRESGVVKLSTYAHFLERLGGSFWVCILLAMMTIGQGLAVGTNVWLARWSRMSYAGQQRRYNLTVYVLLVAAAVVASFMRTSLFFNLTLRASKKLHNDMLRCVLRAPVLFFDSNPVGRILNRYHPV